METPLWARIIGFLSPWKCCYLTSTEIRFRRGYWPPKAKEGK